MKKLFLILPLIVLLAVSCKSNTQISTQTPVVNQQTKVTNQTQTQDQTANWETYSDVKTGFQIKYPDNYSISQTLPFVVFQAKKDANIESDLPNVNVRVYSNSKILTLENWWKNYIDSDAGKSELLTQTNRKSITVAGNPAYYVSTSTSWTSIPFDTVYVAHSKQVYAITANFGSDLYADNVYSKMVSTLSFIK